MIDQANMIVASVELVDVKISVIVSGLLLETALPSRPSNFSVPLILYLRVMESMEVFSVNSGIGSFRENEEEKTERNYI
ncbi:hypothetical protein IC575_029631 [Cucumis melo]